MDLLKPSPGQKTLDKKQAEERLVNSLLRSTKTTDFLLLNFSVWKAGAHKFRAENVP